MKNKFIVSIIVTICSLAVVIFYYSQKNNSEITVSQFNNQYDFYTQEIQPIFDQKCVACHSCFNSPCQLNLTSYEGVQRGAHKENIFDFNNLSAKKPTRLYQDANNEQQWQELGFFSVTQKSPKDLLLKLVSELEGIESNKQDHYDSEYSRVCIENAEPASLDTFIEKNPAGRMPFGFPALSKEEVLKIKLWLDTGAKGPNHLSLEKAIRNEKTLSKKIQNWEIFFNRKGIKAKLSSRYLYEHLFLASIYLKEHPKLFFRLVRSESRDGPIKELATPYPFDKPQKKFFYRLRPITQTITHKRHIPFEFSDKRMKQWNNEFYQATWKKLPVKMPPYGRDASNPFKTFEAIPAKARYQFFLNNSAYHVMTFIKGPVCRGQTAVNVINDHFWVLFINPNKDILVNNQSIYEKVTKKIEFPSSIKDDFAPLIDFRKNYWSTVNEKFKHIKELDKSWLWSSDKSNTNTTLTIYRHFDSAQIIRGLRGRTPKTVWVLDYHIFESIYYNLSAGYNVFAPLLHQVNSRLFMEISRVASEDLFLSFLPKEKRNPLRNSWNRPVPNKKETIVKEIVDIISTDAKEKLSKEYKYAGDHINTQNKMNKQEFLKSLKEDFYTPLQTLSKLELKSSKLYEISKMSSMAASHLPDATILKVDNEVYTLIHNKDHYNVAMLFFEDDRRNRQNDSVDIIKGVATSYINLILDVNKDQLEDFIELMTKANSKKDLEDIYHKFALKRDNAKFWEVFWSISQKSNDEITHELGVLDLNRYINF